MSNTLTFDMIEKEIQDRNISGYDIYEGEQVLIELDNHETLLFMKQNDCFRVVLERMSGEHVQLKKITTIEELSEIINMYI